MASKTSALGWALLLCILCNVIQANAQASKCPTNCLKCDAKKVCKMCKSGYGLAKGKCAKCSATCATCAGTDAAKCTSCKAPLLLTLGGVCSKSYPCKVQNCAECDFSGKCKACRSPFGLSNNKTCEPCPPTCSACLNTRYTLCTECKDGYSLETLTRTCIPCKIAGCLDCRKDVNVCEDGAEFIN